MFEGFREQVKLYQRVALSKVAARQVVQASPAASGSIPSGKAADERVSILPIVPSPPAQDGKDKNLAEAGEAIIGKGKDQVLDALSDILSSAARKQTQVGAAERVMSSAMSAHSSAVGAGKESVRMKGETAAAAGSSASAYASRAGVTVTEGVKRAAQTASAAGAKVGEEGQDAMESLKSVVSEASAAAAGTAKSAAGKVGEAVAGAAKGGDEAAKVAQQAMAHDEL